MSAARLHHKVLSRKKNQESITVYGWEMGQPLQQVKSFLLSLLLKCQNSFDPHLLVLHQWYTGCNIEENDAEFLVRYMWKYL
jgi:hypothetical protein